MMVSICTLVATVSFTLVQASYESQQEYEYREEKEVEGSPGSVESRDDTERSLQEFKEIIKDGIEARSDWIPIHSSFNPDELVEKFGFAARTFNLLGGGEEEEKYVDYEPEYKPEYKSLPPVYVPVVDNTPLYATPSYSPSYSAHSAAQVHHSSVPVHHPPAAPVHVTHVVQQCDTKGSYCMCHYCKCEKGHVTCKDYHEGYGKKYCYGEAEGEFCNCDFCKCQHGYGIKGGYSSCVH